MKKYFAVLCLVLFTSFAWAAAVFTVPNGLAVTGNITSTGTIIGSNSPLIATTASLGGAALLAGACATASTTVTGATTAMAVVTSPTTYPGDGADWQSYVSAAGTVTTKVCAMIALTPIASTYNLRVVQ